MNATTAFTLVLAVLLAWCSLYAIYFNFVRPVVLARLRFWASEARDNLNMLLLSGSIRREDEVYQIVKRRSDVLTQLPLEGLNLTNVLLGRSFGENAPSAIVREENAKIRNASPELSAIHDKMTVALMGSFSANSPCIVGVVVVGILGIATWSTFAQGLRRSVAIFFWDGVYTKQTKSKVAAAAEDLLCSHA